MHIHEICDENLLDFFSTVFFLKHTHAQRKFYWTKTREKRLSHEENTWIRDSWHTHICIDRERKITKTTTTKNKTNKFNFKTKCAHVQLPFKCERFHVVYVLFDEK